MITIKHFILALAVVACIHAEDEVANEIGVTPTLAPAPKTSMNEDRGRLITHLLKNYDRRDYPSNMLVKFGLALLKINLNDHDSVLETDAWVRQTWTDPRLTWHPEEYGNLTVVRLPPTEVWRPDVMLYNDARHTEAIQCKDTNVLVYSTGKVLWVPPCHFHSHCTNLTLDTHPLDIQTCNLKFGSWTMDGHTLDLQFYDNKPSADVKDLYDTSNWEFTGSSAEREVKYYDCCKEPYVSLDFHLSIKRKGGSCGHH